MAHTKLHSKDNAAARRRLRRRFIDTLRKPTTMPTKLAKDRMRIPQGSAKRNDSFPTGSCHSEIGNYMRLGVRKHKAVSPCLNQWMQPALCFPCTPPTWCHHKVSCKDQFIKAGPAELPLCRISPQSARETGRYITNETPQPILL